MNSTQAQPIIEIMISGDSFIEWPLIKVLMAILGGFALYAIIFMFNDPPSSLKIKTSFQKGSFVIISALGGLAILRPEDALAAFPAGLIGWYLVLRHIEGHKQEFKDLSVGSITRDEISESVYGLNEIKESYENGRR